VIELHRVALDIDDPGDVSEFIRREPRASVYELLAAMGVPERLGVK
jgi:hypothetical protein